MPDYQKLAQFAIERYADANADSAEADELLLECSTSAWAGAKDRSSSGDYEALVDLTAELVKWLYYYPKSSDARKAARQDAGKSTYGQESIIKELQDLVRKF